MNIQTNLKKLGFSDTEASIYYYLMQHGSSFAGEIIKATNKHRQLIYNSLDDLAKNGFVSKNKLRGKYYYSLDNPQRLENDFKLKSKIAQGITEIAKELATKDDSEKVDVFHKDNDYSVSLADFRDRAMATGEFYVIRSETTQWSHRLGKVFDKHIAELHKMKLSGVDIFLIFFEEERSQAELIKSRFPDYPYTIKIVPNELKSPNSAWISGSHVYVHTPTVDPIIIHVDSEPLSKQYHDYFWRLWHSGETFN